MNKYFNIVILITSIFFILIFMGKANVEPSILSEKFIKMEDSLRTKPEWYGMLPEAFKPEKEKQIKLLEDMRMKYRASHQNLVYSILSTAWAVERAQYDSLKQARISYSNLTDEGHWKVVLLSRLQTFINTTDLEVHEFSKFTPKDLSERAEAMIRNIDIIMKDIENFEDIVKFVICMEEEMGNLIDPTGILIELNSILGGRLPSEDDINWYQSIIKKARVPDYQ